MATRWNISSCRACSISSVVVVGSKQPINKCLIGNRCHKGNYPWTMHIVSKRSVVLLEIEQIREFFIHFYGHVYIYIWPANNAMPMNVNSLHLIVSSIFILTIFPIVSAVSMRKHITRKGEEKKSNKKGCLLQKNVKLNMNVHNVHIMTISSSNELSDHTQSLFYSNGLNSFYFWSLLFCMIRVSIQCHTI